MIFDVYGRFDIEVLREHGHWVAYRVAPGLRLRDYDTVLASEAIEADLATLLDDTFQELAIPGHSIRRVD